LESFSFSFFCDICGKERVSEPEPFQSNGFTAIEHEEARRLIWAQEHKAAFEKANLEASLNFNKCPKCGKRVCDDCFNFAPDEKDEVCKECLGSK
jgi:hypothetical protein